MALVTVQRSPTPSEADLLDDFHDLEGEVSESSTPRPASHRSLSEFYFTVKGAAVILSHSDQSLAPHSSHGSEIEEHLQAMLHLIRPQDTLSMAVRLQSTDNHTRYLAVVTSPSEFRAVVLLGIDFSGAAETSIGLVVPIWASTRIQVDGDGGIRVDSASAFHLFKPISVQAMWSVFQCLHKELARVRTLKISSSNWTKYYESQNPSKDEYCSMWHYSILEDHDASELRADPSVAAESRLPATPPPGGVCPEKLVRYHLRQIMQSVDLDDVTSRDIREKLEQVPALRGKIAEQKALIDREMLVILGQLDRPSQVFPYLFLGTEWNASNWEELRSNNVGYIVNVTKEVDNFFPTHFHYMKIWVSDEESTELLRHWNRTYEFIKQAKEQKVAVLVHCKKGISRSSSTVIAYAMKEYGWSLEQALGYVKKKRGIITPNKGFMDQLATFNGMLEASSNRHSAVFNADDPPEDASGSRNSEVAVQSRRDGLKLAVGHVRQQREDYERRCNESSPSASSRTVSIVPSTDDCLTDSSSDGESTVRSLVNIFEERTPKEPERGGVIFRVNSWNLGSARSSTSCAVSP
ncbi:hypothetical protein QR680_013329 [Steinernema hermaphroditum]|uniref:protein-serine/threonine phosphatase n=1 Tax=Steinernema hermaphroditum TaxID=289476 RepID=A0AA39I6I7_9BILA|nr:hypothetical protein QR680_013329 [Steinernema hermaphroditum]